LRQLLSEPTFEPLEPKHTSTHLITRNGSFSTADRDTSLLCGNPFSDHFPSPDALQILGIIRDIRDWIRCEGLSACLLLFGIRKVLKWMINDIVSFRPSWAVCKTGQPTAFVCWF
jgi:hypothetical protein